MTTAGDKGRGIFMGLLVGFHISSASTKDLFFPPTLATHHHKVKVLEMLSMPHPLGPE